MMRSTALIREDSSASSILSPQKALFVLLGASRWPKWRELECPNGGAQFVDSAEGIRKYILDDFGLPQENLLNLFDLDESPDEIDLRLAAFLNNRTAIAKERQTPITDLLVYYVGHGGFEGSTSDFYLAIVNSRPNNRSVSSIRMESLARTIRENARHIRCYLILDCCFSGEATRFMQSPPMDLVETKTRIAFEHHPNKGTALLCSSARHEASHVPPNKKYTMFTGALLRALHEGSDAEPDYMSLQQIGDVTWHIIEQDYGDDGVRPEVRPGHMPEGDITRLALFPNFAAHPSEARQDWFDLIATEFEKSDALFTVSSEQTLLLDKNRLPYVGFRDLVSRLSAIDRADGRQRILIWILEDGKPELGYQEAVRKIENVEALRSRFKRLRSYFKEADTWKWLQQRAVIVLHDARGGRPDVPRLPALGYREILISEPPDTWKKSSEFFTLFGNERERWRRTSYSIFLTSPVEDFRSNRTSCKASEYNLRYFGHAKLPPDRDNASVKALKLPTLDSNYSIAFGTVYAAAAELLGIGTMGAGLTIDGTKIDHAHAIDKLRLLGFSLLRLDQFMKR
jgi:Caspase domain